VITEVFHDQVYQRDSSNTLTSALNHNCYNNYC